MAPDPRMPHASKVDHVDLTHVPRSDVHRHGRTCSLVAVTSRASKRRRSARARPRRVRRPRPATLTGQLAGVVVGPAPVQPRVSALTAIALSFASRASITLPIVSERSRRVLITRRIDSSPIWAADRLLRPSGRRSQLMRCKSDSPGEERPATLERLRDGHRRNGTGVRFNQALEVALQPMGRFEFSHSPLMWRHPSSLHGSLRMVARAQAGLTATAGSSNRVGTAAPQHLAGICVV